jgi:hypothetical protein
LILDAPSRQYLSSLAEIITKLARNFRKAVVYYRLLNSVAGRLSAKIAVFDDVLSKLRNWRRLLHNNIIKSQRGRGRRFLSAFFLSAVSVLCLFKGNWNLSYIQFILPLLLASVQLIEKSIPIFIYPVVFDIFGCR